MITNTFQILDRVSERREQEFWLQGIADWDIFTSNAKVKGISKTKKAYFDRQIGIAKKALYQEQSYYFVDILPSTETWRLYDFFKEDAVFLDIETDGLGASADITVMGLFDGISTKSMIKGINLDYHALARELQKYKLIITFNGSSFDLPFIAKRYDILPKVPHIDLRHCCSKLGLTGGLKKIERDMGIRRNRIIEDFSGGDALTLWRMYKTTGDSYYLNLLVEYNEEDIINLKKIMGYCYNILSNKLKDKVYCQASCHQTD